MIHSPSGFSYNTLVSYEVVTKGKSGEIAVNTRSDVVCFNLNYPGEQPVSFHYSVLSGSAEDMHMAVTTFGEVVLSQAEPVMGMRSIQNSSILINNS